jgi:hypothetical protein
VKKKSQTLVSLLSISSTMKTSLVAYSSLRADAVVAVAAEASGDARALEDAVVAVAAEVSGDAQALEDVEAAVAVSVVDLADAVAAADVVDVDLALALAG